MKFLISAEPELATLPAQHCRAICDEIGYRLSLALRPTSADLPKRLTDLLDRLALLDDDARPTVPAFARMHSEAEA